MTTTTTMAEITTTMMAEITTTTTTTSTDLQTMAAPTAKATTIVPTKKTYCNLNNQPYNKQHITKTQQTTTVKQPTMTIFKTMISSIISLLTFSCCCLDYLSLLFWCKTKNNSH
jgi:hypothetical protein